MHMAKISFLIVNRNGGDVFKQGVHSIVQNCRESGIEDYEIVVVDNKSLDDIKWLENIQKLKLIRNKNNEFFSKPTNDTVKFSKGNILFILNNDVILQKHCLTNLLKELSNKNVDAVVPQLLYPDGRVQNSITGIPTWKDIFLVAIGLHIFFPKKDKWRLRDYDYTKKHVITDQPMFSALMLKRDCWNKVGGLDLRLPLLWNDVDWFYRFHHARQTCIYVPNAKAKHVHGMSVNKIMWKKLYWLSEGCYIFLTKSSKNKSVFFKILIFFLCAITFFERIPLELFLQYKRKLNKNST